MEPEKSLVKAAETRLPKFVEDAYESVEKMEKFANILLESKLVPNHFYEQLPDKKPDFSRGKTPAVVAVLIQGYQLQLPPLTALQHIIPVNGLLSIKGDLAKSMIFNSGKLKSGSWVEEESGSIEAGDYMVKITATRSDNGQTLSRSFSVAQAKRAGLWITEQQVNGQDGWKYKSSAWWKYPTRMCNYRALGFIARDMFPDVMAGIYTTEEAMDLPRDTTEVIETTDGNKIIIPDKEHIAKRSAKMTERVADKIQPDKFAPVKTDSRVEDIIPDEEAKKIILANLPEREKGETGNEFVARYNKYVDEAMKKYPELHLLPLQPGDDESPFKADKGSGESMNGVKVLRDPTTNEITNMEEINASKQEEQAPAQEGKWTLKEMEAMDSKLLLAKVNSDMDMMDASETIGGKNTNLKLRKIIDAWQNGKLAEYVAPYMVAEPPAQEPTTGDPGMKPNKNFDKEKADREADEFLNGPAKTPEKPSKVSIVNKYGLEIVEKPEGANREFSVTKDLFNKFLGVNPKIDNPRYLVLAEQMGILKEYPDREIFLKSASVSEINLLLNNN
jgi:hypothetical protein